MYARLYWRVVAPACFVLLVSAAAAAQETHQHGAPAAAQEEHQHQTPAADAGGIPATRNGSGTAWLPDATPMHARHGEAGDWTLMLHANAFLHYLNETGERGSDQLGSINWVMGMAERKAGPPESIAISLCR